MKRKGRKSRYESVSISEKALTPTPLLRQPSVKQMSCVQSDGALFTDLTFIHINKLNKLS